MSRRRPSSGTPLRSDGIARGIVFCSLPGVGDVVSKNRAEFLGNSKLTPTTEGMAFENVDLTGDGVHMSPSGRLHNITTDYSMLSFSAFDAMDPYGVLISVPYDSVWSSPFASMLFYRNQSSTDVIHWYSYDSGSIQQVSNAGFLDIDGSTHQYLVTRSGTRLRFIKDGVKFQSDLTIQSEIIDWGNKRNVNIFNQNDTDLGQTTQGKNLLSIIWDREITEEEAAELNKNPWQIFKPQRILIPMVGGAIEIAGEGQETTVIITDVNGTETWLDGAENLVISGSGFA